VNIHCDVISHFVQHFSFSNSFTYISVVSNISQDVCNSGNLLKFNWSSWKFLPNGMAVESSGHNNLAAVQLLGSGDNNSVYFF